MESFLVSTASVAVGELGDKTQLLSLMLASRLRRPLPIIAGVLVATVGNHLLACWFGEWVGGLLTSGILRWVLGLSFIAVAIWALIPDKQDDQLDGRSHRGVFAFTVVTFFLAEMGDKTQVVAVALAARYHTLVPVVLGSTLGMMLVNVPTVVFADRAVRWIPLKLVRTVAAAIYTLLGIATLVGYQGLLPAAG